MRNTILFTLVMVLSAASAYAQAPLIYKVVPDTGKFEVHLKQCAKSERDALYNTLIARNIVLKISNEDVFMSLDGGEYRAADESLVGDWNVYDAPRPENRRRGRAPYYGFWRTQSGTWVFIAKIHEEKDNGSAAVELIAIRYTGKTCFDRWKGLVVK